MTETVAVTVGPTTPVVLAGYVTVTGTDAGLTPKVSTEGFCFPAGNRPAALAAPAIASTTASAVTADSANLADLARLAIRRPISPAVGNDRPLRAVIRQWILSGPPVFAMFAIL